MKNLDKLVNKSLADQYAQLNTKLATIEDNSVASKTLFLYFTHKHWW